MAENGADRPKEPSKRKRRGWRLVLLIVVVIALVVVAARIAFQLLLPSLADRWAAGHGLTLEWRRLQLSLWSGRVELADLEIDRHAANAGGEGESDVQGMHGDPVARVDSILLDVDTMQLLRGRFRIFRVAVDGVTASLTRRADGTVVLEGWESKDTRAPPKPPEASALARGPAPADPPMEFDFDLPVEIERLRIDDVRVNWRDDAVAPPLAAEVSLDVKGDDLGSRSRDGRLELEFHGGDELDSVMLVVEGPVHGPNARVEATLLVRGLSEGLLRRYGAPAGIATEAERLDLALSANVELAASDATASVLAGRVSISRLEVLADGEEELHASVETEVRRLSSAEFDVGLATLTVRGRAARTASGAWRAAGLRFDETPDSAEPESEADDDSPPYRFRVAELRPAIEVQFRDETSEPANETKLTLHDSFAKDLDFDPLHAESPILVELRARGAEAALKLVGELRPLAENRRATLVLQVDGVQSLLKKLGIDADLEDARLDVKVDAQARSADDVLTASLALAQMRFADGGRELLSLESLKVTSLIQDPSGLKIESVEIVKPLVTASREAYGSLRFAGIKLGGGSAKDSAKDSTPAGDPTLPAAPEPPPRFAIGRVSLAGGVVNWSDEAVAPAVESKVGLDVKIEGFDLGESAPAQVEVVASVEGGVERLRVAGTLSTDPRAFAASLDVAADGLRPGPLSVYVPKAVVLEDGSVRAHVEAGLEESASGGRSARVAVKDVEFRETSDGEPLFTLARVAVVAPQCDPAKGPIVVEELAVEGLKLARPELSLDLRSRAPVTIELVETENPVTLELDLTASLPRTAREVKIEIKAAPLAARPTLAVTVAAQGITGAGLAEWIPGLAREQVDSAITDGTFAARFGAEVDVKRRGPLDFDLRDFGGTVWLSDALLRGTPDGPPLAGVTSLEVELASVRPETVDVHVRHVEVTKPIGVVRRTSRGVEVAGLMLEPGPEPAGESAAEPESETAKKPDPEPAPSIPPATAVEPSRTGEFRLDVLTVSEVDFLYIDELATPTTVFPITQLEAEVRGFSSQALEVPRPLQFSATIAGGDLELAKRDERSLVGSVVGSAADLIRRDRAVDLEKRPAWQSLDLSGHLVLAPPVSGYIRVDIRALELQVLKGIAAASGVSIDDGVVDSRIEVRLRGDEGAVVDSRTSFSSLKMSEPEGGPISSWLNLKAPLGAALFVLRDDDGRQQVPLRFSIPKEGMRKGEIAKLVSKTLLKLITDAIQAAPMRVVSGTLDAVQLSKIPGWDKLPGFDSIPGLSKVPVLNRIFGVKKDEEEAPLVIELPPGSTRLAEGARQDLIKLRERLRGDDKLELSIEHQLGSDDRARLEKIAKPKPEDLAQLATRFRRRREELAFQHDLVAEQARHALATGNAEASERTLEDLRATDREAAIVSRALDQVLELQSDRTIRQDDRLVRRAATTLGDLRLAAVRDLIVQGGLPGVETRLDFKPVRSAAENELTVSRIVIEIRRR